MPRLIMPSEHFASWQKIKKSGLKIKDIEAQQEAMASTGGGTLAGFYKRQAAVGAMQKTQAMFRRLWDTGIKIGMDAGDPEASNDFFRRSYQRIIDTPLGEGIKQTYPTSEDLPQIKNFAAEGTVNFNMTLAQDEGEFKRGSRVNVTTDRFGNQVNMRETTPEKPAKLIPIPSTSRMVDPYTGEVKTPAKPKEFQPRAGKLITQDDPDPESTTGYMQIDTESGKIYKNTPVPSTVGLEDLRESQIKSAGLSSRKERMKLIKDFTTNFVTADGRQLTTAEGTKAINAYMKGEDLPENLKSIKASKDILGNKMLGKPKKADILKEAKSITNLYQKMLPGGGVADLTVAESRAAARAAYAGEPPRDDLVMRSTIKDVKVRNASIVKLVSDYKKQISDLTKIRTLYDNNKKDYVGRDSSISGWLRRKTHVGVDPGFESFRANVNTFFTSFLKSLSGSQVTEYEEVRIKQITPNVSDSPTEFKAKLDALDRLMNRHLNINIDALDAAGYPEMMAVREGVPSQGEESHRTVELSPSQANDARKVYTDLKAKLGHDPTREEYTAALGGR